MAHIDLIASRYTFIHFILFQVTFSFAQFIYCFIVCFFFFFVKALVKLWVKIRNYEITKNEVI